MASAAGRGPHEGLERTPRATIRSRITRTTEAAIEAAGIDLDPVPPGHHRHGDEVHASDHSHPHQQSEPGETPIIGIVGAARSGPPWARPCRGPAGRSTRSPAATRADVERAQALTGATRAFAEAQALVEEVELIIVAIPDDAIAGVRRRRCGCTAGRPWSTRAGRSARTCSRRRWRPGPRSATFHPLVAFADTERAVAALHGATIAIEARRPAGRPAGPDGRGDRRPPRPARARLQERLPRRGRPGGRRLRGPARRHRGTRPGRRARRSRVARHLRAAHRGDAGQRAGAGGGARP